MSALRNNVQKILRFMIPWILCIAVFFYLFQIISVREVLQAFQHTHVTRFALAALAYFIFIFVVDTLALQKSLSRFVVHIPIRDMILIRGTTYLMMIINYAAAQGILALTIKKRSGAKFSRVAGTLSLLTFIDVSLVITSSFLSLSLHPIFYRGYNLAQIANFLGLFLFSFILFWILFWKKIVPKFENKLNTPRWISKFLKLDSFSLFREARLQDYLTTVLWRIPVLVAVIAGLNLGLWTFDRAIGWHDIFLFNPVIMLITSLPITPAGLGTGQVMASSFFSHSLVAIYPDLSSSSAASLLVACTLLWGLANQALKAFFGSIFFILYKQKYHNNSK